MSARFRIDSLQYAVGAFCLLAGLLMVLVPHRFLQPPAFATLDPFLFWAGSLSLIGGILIVSVAAMVPPRRWVIAAHLSVGLSLLLVAAGYLMTRGWIGMVAFTVLGAGTLAAPWLTSPQSSVRPPAPRSSHLLPWLLALILLLSSVVMLVAPNEFDAPNFDLLRPWLPTVALLDLVGGVALFVVLLRPVRPRVVRAVHVVAGAGILAHVLLVTWPNGNLIGLASYAAFWLPLAALPWLDRPQRPEPTVPLARVLALALALAAALPLIVGAVVDAHLDNARAHREALADLQDTAHLLAEAVQSFAQTQRGIANSLATRTELLTLPVQEVNARLALRSAVLPDIQVLGLYTADGVLVGRSDSAPLSSSAGQPIFEAVRADRQAHTLFQRSAWVGRPVIISGVPMLASDGSLLAVATASSDPARLLELLNAGRPRGTEAFLIDEDLRLLVSPDPSRVGATLDTPAATLVRTQTRAADAAILGGARDESLVAYQRILDLGWTVIVERPSRTVMADAYADHDRRLPFLLAWTLAAILAATWIARRLAAPLSALAAAVERFGHGEITALPASPVREAAQLATAFDDARDRLLNRTAAYEQAAAEVRILNQHLEQRVHERTAQLASATVEAQRMAAIVASSDDAIISKDLDGVVTSWNPAAERLYGYPAADAIGRSLAFLFPSDRPDELPALLDRLRQGLPIATFDTVRKRKDGRLIDVSVRISPIRDASGNVVGASGIGRDVTDERQRQRQAAQAEKLRILGQLASGVAHDLNQSLTLVAGHADIALDLVPQHDTQLRQSLDTIVTTVMDGGRSVSRLLTFSRQQPDRPPERIPIPDLLHEVAVLTAPRWRDEAHRGGRVIDVQVHVADDGLAVSGQADTLREALTNLVFNAVDAMPAGGSIRLEARGLAGTVEIAVLDNGLGMPEAVRARAFEPFFTTKGASGTGLGLAMVANIVEQHHGTIAITSSPGVGTTFRISLPLAADVTQASSDAPALPRTSRPLRVLAVDDQPSVLALLTKLLQRDGHTVLTAPSGEDAINVLLAERFDLVVSDLGLGDGMTGWDLAAHVRETCPGTPFLLATGWGAGIELEEAHARGVNAVLAKPYRPGALRAAIASALAPLPESPAVYT